MSSANWLPVESRRHVAKSWEFDLSRSFKDKFNDTVGVPMYDFRSASNKSHMSTSHRLAVIGTWKFPPTLYMYRSMYLIGPTFRTAPWPDTSQLTCTWSYKLWIHFEDIMPEVAQYCVVIVGIIYIHVCVCGTVDTHYFTVILGSFRALTLFFFRKYDLDSNCATL